MKNTSDIDQASRINPFTRRRLLMGSSFLLGLAATSTTGSMIQAAQPISQKHKGKELLDKDSTCKRRIQGPGFYHVGLFTTDMDTTIRFYTEGFGFTKRYRWNLTRATEPLPTGEFVELKFNIEFLDLGDGNYLEVIVSH